MLVTALKMRQFWMAESGQMFSTSAGKILEKEQLRTTQTAAITFGPTPESEQLYQSRDKFLKDYNSLLHICISGPLNTFCRDRLSLLKLRFKQHVIQTKQLQKTEQLSVPLKNFVNIIKVDNHIHAAAAMTKKSLLSYMKRKFVEDRHVPVLLRNGQEVTLGQVEDEVKQQVGDLNYDTLDVHGGTETNMRFDTFNSKYSPFRENQLREIFMKTDNHVNGAYFADLLKAVFSDLEVSKCQKMEPRLSIYGKKQEEWINLAQWYLRNNVHSVAARWLIQVPRLYDLYSTKKIVSNFGEFLDNLFNPLFEVTKNPDSQPALHQFLQNVSGFDSVDDESKSEKVQFDVNSPLPGNYNSEQNPDYAYYMYYMFANLTSLNALRRKQGLNTFTLRPHCGETGSINHLAIAFLTAESIAHGVVLNESPVLMYLFYLAQVGITMSPKSNNGLFTEFNKNPLPEYFKIGLNISLSTDDPLIFHLTEEPLMEEYAIIESLWKFSQTDLCELARNSVLQSGFEEAQKRAWIGDKFKEEGVGGNDISRTNVPNSRIKYRHDTLVATLQNLFKMERQ